jgi:hypothetical protein
LAGENKTIVVRTGSEFCATFRRLEAVTDGLQARRIACERAGDAAGAEKAALEFAERCQELQDAILAELERHWAPMLLGGDATIPEFPDGWRLQFYGRLLRMDYDEREAFKGP